MRVKRLVAAAALVVITAWAPPPLSRSASSQGGLRIESSLSKRALLPAEDLNVTVRLSAVSGGRYRFRIGSFPELFGVYLLGPWGVVQPDPKKVLPQNWMHQQHSVSKEVVVTKGQPFEITFRLSDYFDINDLTAFRPGRYQVNVKFYAAGLDLKSPVDAEPQYFEVLQPGQPR